MIIKGNDDLSHVYIIKRFDQAILIDPSHSIDQIEHALQGLKLNLILLTHAHIDHTLLIDLFKVPIYMHKNDYEMLFNDEQNGSKELKIRKKFQKEMLDIRFVDDMQTIVFADESVIVYHTPGHTKGSVCYLHRNMLYTGDTLFKEGVGRTDLVGGSTALLNKSIKKLFSELPQLTKILPGHDESSTMAYEKKHNEYVIKVLQR
ncbi:MAG: MBL fold metallo-hydrolase [Acholeplasma sp.]|nr:MBL fold metallo-hydrolase [Acholeplasma sp.]